MNTISANKDLVVSMRAVLKIFFKKSVLLLYVAQKVTGASTKKAFKDTNFYVCFEGTGLVV